MYLGLGIEPAINLFEQSGHEPITLAVPVTLGLGLDNYYEDSSGKNDTFGYLSVKPTLSTPLSCIPSDFGEWTLSASVEMLFLGNTNKTLNHGDDFELVGTIGLSMTY